MPGASVTGGEGIRGRARARGVDAGEDRGDPALVAIRCAGPRRSWSGPPSRAPDTGSQIPATSPAREANATAPAGTTGGTRAGPFYMPALRQARLLARADRLPPHRHCIPARPDPAALPRAPPLPH